MTVADRVSEQAYLELAAGDPQGQWELHEGRPRQKPGMSVEHGDVMVLLVVMLHGQLDRDEYRVRATHARLRRSSQHYSIPDVAVVPASLERTLRGRPGTLDLYAAALPLVVEIWSPSAGAYDIDAKVPQYQQRGDEEIWRLHPYERTLRAWRRQPDGSYLESLHRGGVVRVEALPGVRIDLDALFAG